MTPPPAGAGSAGRQPKLPPAYRLVALDSVASTNDEARRLAAAGAEDGTLVWAREQTQGRGRLGRGWTSPPGNLYLSLVLRPERPLAEAAQLGFVAAVALCDALGSVVPPLVEVTLKWPNDVLVNERKAAGILLETMLDKDGALDALILGMGVNIAHYPEESAYPATSLVFEGTRRDLDPAELLEAFARHFLTWVNRWLEDGFEPVRQGWLNRSKAKGHGVEVRLPDRTVQGTFEDLDGAGGLRLRLGDGTVKTITVGDVFWLR